MPNSAIFAIGVSILIFSKSVFKTIHDDWTTEWSAQKRWLMNIFAAALVGLGVFLITSPIVSPTFFDSYFPAPRATPLALQGQTPPPRPATEPAPGGNGIATTVQNTPAQLATQQVPKPAPAVVTSSEADPSSPGTASELTTLILAALGIVMTLVTAIVIAVSRSAVEDIRRVEEQLSPRVKKHLKRLDKKWDSLFRLADLKLSVATRSAGLAEFNRNAVRTHQSDLVNDPVADTDVDRRMKARQRIQNLYSPTKYDSSFFTLFHYTFNEMKEDLKDEIETDEIEHIKNLSQLVSELLTNGIDGSHTLSDDEREKLATAKENLAKLIAFFRKHRPNPTHR